MVDYENFDLGDLGDLCPKFDIHDSQSINVMEAAPRKPSNVTITSQKAEAAATIAV